MTVNQMENAQSSPTNTKILLLCLGFENYYLSSSISVQHIYKCFKMFGVCKIMIFKRKPYLKAFLEFPSVKHSIICKKYVNGKNMNDYGILKVYSSHKTNLQEENKFLDFKDFESQGVSTKISNSLKLKKKSKVLLISNLDNNFDDVKEIFNIFSNFGKICKICYMKNHQKIFIEFKNIKNASRSLKIINKIKLRNLKVKANFSYYNTLDFDVQSINQNNEIAVFSKQENKKKENLVKKLSKSIIVSVSGNVCFEDILGFLKFYKVPKNYTILQKNDYLLYSNKLVLKFDFKNVSQAFFVIKKCHSLIINNSKLHINFISN